MHIVYMCVCVVFVCPPHFFDHHVGHTCINANQTQKSAEHQNNLLNHHNYELLSDDIRCISTYQIHPNPGCIKIIQNLPNPARCLGFPWFSMVFHLRTTLSPTKPTSRRWPSLGQGAPPWWAKKLWRCGGEERCTSSAQLEPCPWKKTGSFHHGVLWFCWKNWRNAGAFGGIPASKLSDLYWFCVFCRVGLAGFRILKGWFWLAIPVFRMWWDDGM